MTHIIIGSTALAAHFPGETREPKDMDVFSDGDESGEDSFWDDRLHGWFWPDDWGYATVDELYTIKVSHSHWDLSNGSWGKHMADILFLQEKNANLIPELYDILYKIWIDKHGPKKMTFSESEEFFDDAVVRKYD